MQMPKTGYGLKTTYKGKKTAVIGGNEKEKGKK